MLSDASIPVWRDGEKELPEGAEDALAGLTFVISGTLDRFVHPSASTPQNITVHVCLVVHICIHNGFCS